MELMGCTGLSVPGEVMHHVVKIESSYNPFAIGVVGGRLIRQPKDLAEALATVSMLESKGYNFSLGLAQVNRYNLGKYGLESYEKAFDVCSNLRAGSRILAECHGRSGNDWGKSFSCYYSGNFVTGFRHGYVQKLYASINGSPPQLQGGAQDAIAVVGTASRRGVEVSRYPLRPGQRSLEQRIVGAVGVPLIGQVSAGERVTASTRAPLALSAEVPGVSHPPVATTNSMASATVSRPPAVQTDGMLSRSVESPPPASDEAFVF
jgi:type IV secretion system protein VirB1